MNTRIFLLLPACLSLLCLLLSACGNKGDLLFSSQSPPEDAGRYLIKPEPEPAQVPEAVQDDADMDDDGR